MSCEGTLGSTFPEKFCLLRDGDGLRKGACSSANVTFSNGALREGSNCFGMTGNRVAVDFNGHELKLWSAHAQNPNQKFVIDSQQSDTIGGERTARFRLRSQKFPDRFLWMDHNNANVQRLKGDEIDYYFYYFPKQGRLSAAKDTSLCLGWKGALRLAAPVAPVKCGEPLWQLDGPQGPIMGTGLSLIHI